MTVKDLVGNFSIIGSNQNDSDSTYKGILTLKLNDYQQILADWTINNDQKQKGIGFFKDNILVINFEYEGNDSSTYKGVVVYRCLTKDILDGFWSEEFGNPFFLGSERCFRIKDTIRLD
ncbi:hypothetical protein [uncultured Tenacibaculum sp.]|uniref:hypothetical protein n=1 Tax=uncultured Tenacibaculum sp. TaxID=174713 RepID=UPI0026100429|nr:hypothetical protein [uncultured Tenacibaculum sp.]